MEKINLDDYKGIIFDLDGIIYNIINAIKKAVEDIIKKYNLTLDSNSILEEIAHLIEEIQHYPVPKIILNSYNLLKLDFLEGLSFMKKVRIVVFLFNQFNEYRGESGLFDGIYEIIDNMYKKKLGIRRSPSAEKAQKYRPFLHILKNHLRRLAKWVEWAQNRPNGGRWGAMLA